MSFEAIRSSNRRARELAELHVANLLKTSKNIDGLPPCLRKSKRLEGLRPQAKVVIDDLTKLPHLESVRLMRGGKRRLGSSFSTRAGIRVAYELTRARIKSL